MTPSAQVNELIHEMRNELAVAKANLEGLIDGKLAPSRERLLGILQALSQLDSLIEDLRVINPNAQMSLHPILIDVCELLDREYAAIDALARAKDITVSIHRCAVRSERCAQFYGDPARIGQIVKNILLNAVHYTPSGGTVSVDCDHPSDQLEVRISDSGPGIREGEINELFEAGFRGSASAHTDGSGHGLAIVKQIVEAHGGVVTAAAASAHGASFTVRLPGVAPAGERCETCHPVLEQRKARPT